MSQISHDPDGRQIVSPARLRAILRMEGETCYCLPRDRCFVGVEWDAGECPEHADGETEETHDTAER